MWPPRPDSSVFSVSASHALGRGFVPQPGHTKDHHKNDTKCLFGAKISITFTRHQFFFQISWDIFWTPHNYAILFINKINIWSLKINIPQLKFTFYYKETCLLLTQQGLKLRRTDISIKGIENSSQIFIIFEKKSQMSTYKIYKNQGTFPGALLRAQWPFATYMYIACSSGYLQKIYKA